MSEEPPINPPGLAPPAALPSSGGEGPLPPAVTEAQKRAYRNRSSGASWFDAPPEKVPLGRRGRRERGGGGGAAFDVGYPMMSMPMQMPMMMMQQQPQLPQPQQPQQRFSVRQGTTPLCEIPIGTRCTGVVAALRESFGFIR